MATIQTGIELNDQFTGVLYGIINSVNLAVYSMQEMQSTMNTPVNSAMLDGAIEQINQATMLANDYQDTLDGIQEGASKVISIPTSAPPIQEPVEIPVMWNTDGLDVFTGTGIERFQQEVQSTNNMLNTLNATQVQISQTASSIDILPDAAIQDITGMGQRLQVIHDRIQQIESNPINMGTDTANTELEQLRSQLNQAIHAQNDLNTAMDNMDVSGANDAYMRLSRTVSGTERYIRDNTDEQGRFNQSVSECQAQAARVSYGFAGWQKAIIVANQAMGLIKSTLSSVGLMDMSGAFNRLDTMNRFEKTITTMTGDADLANAALSQLRNITLDTAYGLDVAAKSTQGFMTRGMSLGAATNQVRVWADAVSFYGEGTNVQLESVVDAIGKMYSKGKVEADQLDRLFDAGIGAAEIYANAVGESVSSVKEDLSAGTISASQFIDVVSHAMDSGISAGAAKDAGSTWATTFANMHAAITRGWTNIITDLDSALASHGLPSSMQMVATFGKNMENTLNHIGNSMDFVVSATMQVYDVMSTVGSFIADNWSIISPIIYGVIAALATYAIYLGIVKGIELAAAAAKGALALAQFIHVTALSASTGATIKAIAAQMGLNSAMYACPIVWIVILIIGLIAIIMALCNWIAKMTGITQSGFGIICGVVNVGVAFIRNLVIGLINMLISQIINFYNMTANFAAAFGILFNDPVAAIKAVMLSLFNFIVGVVGKAAALLDAVFGSNLADTVSQFQAKIQTEINATIENAGGTAAQTLNPADYMLDRVDYGDAFDSGAAWGDDIADKVSNFSLSDLFGSTNISSGEDYSSQFAGMSDSLDSISGDTSGISDAMDITKEEMKYLRDIAEQESVNRFTTAEIKIEQTNHNNVSSDVDLDGFINGLNDAMGEAIDTVTEGGIG